jgi:hypothetical protein
MFSFVFRSCSDIATLLRVALRLPDMESCWNAGQAAAQSSLMITACDNVELSTQRDGTPPQSG